MRLVGGTPSGAVAEEDIRHFQLNGEVSATPWL
jgi:hypothetical protein